MELLPRIHLVDGITTNVYLIVEDEGLAVIDTGMPGNAAKIVAYIQKLGRNPHDVRHVLLTHQHIDHIGSAAVLSAETDAAITAHQFEAPAIEGTGPRDLPHWPLNLVFQFLLVPRMKPVHVANRVKGGEMLPVLLGDGGLQVVEAPGHTTGHIAFYLPGRKLLFAGDAYRHRNGRVAPAPTVFNQDTSMAQRSMASLTKLDIEASFPGHGAPILTGAGARLAEAVGAM